MFEKTGSSRYKREVSVTMSLAGQRPFNAFVFLTVDERLIDLLNDPRAFIPVKHANGAVVIVAKANIVSIIESAAEYTQPEQAEPVPEIEGAVEEPEFDAKAEAEKKAKAKESEKPEEKEDPKAKPRVRRTYDPYEILRVPREASLAEIRRAYKARMKAVHPDAIAALDLDEDLEKAALLAAQKVNHAYQQIMKERKAANKDAESDAA
jgi:hypothetical protein